MGNGSRMSKSKSLLVSQSRLLSNSALFTVLLWCAIIGAVSTWLLRKVKSAAKRVFNELQHVCFACSIVLYLLWTLSLLSLVLFNSSETFGSFGGNVASNKTRVHEFGALQTDSEALLLVLTKPVSSLVIFTSFFQCSFQYTSALSVSRSSEKLQTDFSSISLSLTRWNRSKKGSFGFRDKNCIVRNEIEVSRIRTINLIPLTQSSVSKLTRIFTEQKTRRNFQKKFMTCWFYVCLILLFLIKWVFRFACSVSWVRAKNCLIPSQFL